MTPCQKLQIQEGTARRSESMQQSSATQSLHLSFWGLRKIVACSHSSSQCLIVSAVFGTVSSLHPTSFLMIFILVYIYIYIYIFILYNILIVLRVNRNHAWVSFQGFAESYNDTFTLSKDSGNYYRYALL